jgi:hypothetical protein
MASQTTNATARCYGFQDRARYIVALPRVSDDLVHLTHEPAQHFFHASDEGSAHDIEETRLGKHLANAVHDLNHAIRKDDHFIARVECDRRGLKAAARRRKGAESQRETRHVRVSDRQRRSTS